MTFQAFNLFDSNVTNSALLSLSSFCRNKIFSDCTEAPRGLNLDKVPALVQGEEEETMGDGGIEEVGLVVVVVW